ncbi:MAG TPA: hypothetical protein VNA57_10735 [Acidimicrobiales bacterium]|nr:hypothetical protein [Acidimicrobiales bacterium]
MGNGVLVLVSVVAGDADRELGVDERVETDDEVPFGIDSKDERHVDAGRVVAEGIWLPSMADRIPEPKLEPVLDPGPVPDRAASRREGVQEHPIAMAVLVLGTQEHRSRHRTGKGAVDDTAAALLYRLSEQIDDGPTP